MGPPQGFVKEVFCFRYPYFYFQHGESTFTASQQSSTASQLSKDLNKVPLLLQNLAQIAFNDLLDCNDNKDGSYLTHIQNVISILYTSLISLMTLFVPF